MVFDHTIIIYFFNTIAIGGGFNKKFYPLEKEEES